jgi:hypothetical protein
MKILLAVMAIAFLTVAAHAQEMGRDKGRKQPAQKTEDLAKKKADEAAYKNALQKIPVPTEKPDPWKTMR